MANYAVDAELFSERALKLIRNQNTEELIDVVKELNICGNAQLIKHQKFAEYCLKDIIQIIQDETVEKDRWPFNCLLWTALNIISATPIVRKVIWKDKTVLLSLSKSIEHSLEKDLKTFQKVAANFLSVMLVCAPMSFFQQMAEFGIISQLLNILKNKVFAEETLKSVVCCFGLLCDGTDLCKQQLIELKVADAVLKMGEIHALNDDDFSHLAAMTYDDLSMLKVDGSIGRQKFIKTQLDETMFCSNPTCSTLQKDVKFKKCSLCKMTFYCSKSCQVQHWRSMHYKNCPGK